MTHKQLIHKIFSMVPGQKIDEDLLYFLQDGFRTFLFDGQDMNEAFNFKQTNIQSSSMLDARNYNLRLASKNVSGEGVTTRAREMRKKINTFECAIWPKWKNLELPPAGCSELNYFLFRAKKYGRLDLSEKQLTRIL